MVPLVDNYQSSLKKKMTKLKPRISRTYREGAFNCIDFQLYWGGQMYKRESYGKYFSWYVNSSNIHLVYNKDLLIELEREYQKLKRIDKLERILIYNKKEL